MAITVERTTPKENLLTISSMGIIVADAVAALTTTVNAAANQWQNLTAANLTGFRTSDIVQITGAGSAGAKEWFGIQIIGSGGNVSTTNFTIRQLRPIIAAVSGALMERYYRVYTMFFPDRVTLINQGTGVKWEWRRGMAQNSAIKTDSSGAITVLTDSGFVVGARGFHFHPQMAPVNSRLLYEVNYSHPS